MVTLVSNYTITKQQLVNSKTDPFFSTHYFDDQNIVQQFLHCCHQSKTCIEIIQATLSGKTRLIIESSYRYPILMISLKKTNTCYHKLVASFRNVIPPTNFTEALVRNRLIIVKTRLFFLSYMQYMKQFVEMLHKTKWEELEEMDKKVFHALLLNTIGNDMVYELYEQNITHFEVTVDRVASESVYNEMNHSIYSTHKQLFTTLGMVYFALDEFHMPWRELKGVLFHSDYKQQDENNVFLWSQYEQSIHTTHNKVVPNGYPYSEPTTLFHVFRDVVQEYLMKFNQMTIFVSTWSPIREKVDIAQWITLPLLNRDYLMMQLNELQVSEEDRRKYHLNELVIDLIGRPGLFYEWCHRCLQPTARAYASLFVNIQTHVDTLLKQVETQHSTMKQLYLLSLFNIQGLTNSQTEEIVVAGVGYKILNAKIDVEGVLKNQLLKKMNLDVTSIQQEVIHLLQDDHIALCTIGAMHAMLQNNNNELYRLITKWMPNTNTTNAIHYFRIRAKRCYFVNDEMEQIDEVSKMLEDERIWESVIGAKTELNMAEMMFPCDYDNKKCLVTVNMNMHSTTLDEEAFNNAIAKTSIDNMFVDHETVHHKLLSIQQSWRDNYRSITFVRIIVCFGGFTKNQIMQVDAFNQQYASQPIVLVSVKYQEIGQNIFGKLIYEHVSANMSSPNRISAKSNTTKVKVRTSSFNKAWILFPDETSPYESESENESAASNIKRSRQSTRVEEPNKKRKK